MAGAAGVRATAAEERKNARKKERMIEEVEWRWHGRDGGTWQIQI